VLATIAALFAVLEVYARFGYERPDPLPERLAAYQRAQPTLGRHLVAFGTCLGDVFDPPEMRQAWGSSMPLANLSAPAIASMDWYLALSRVLASGAEVEGVLVAFSGDELAQNTSPWEGQVMEQVTWRDLGSLAEVACETPSCAVELGLRKLSVAYRYRGFLANRVWDLAQARLPALPAPTTGEGPVNVPDPGLTRPPGARHPTRPGDPPAPAAAGSPAVAQLGWRLEGSWFSAPDDHVWARRMMAIAHARDIPIVFIVLPLNPDWALPIGGWGEPRDRERIRQMIRAGGGELIELDTRGLGGRHFGNSTHFTAEGVTFVATAIGRALALRFPGGVRQESGLPAGPAEEPPAPPSPP
jgi:hypothetical protein